MILILRFLPNVLLSLAALFFTNQLQAKPLQVYILAGQSNMQGHAKISTFEHIGMDPATKPMLADMLGPDGKPKVCERVWISSIGCSGDDTTEQTGKLSAGFGAATEKIGPEFTFGLYMEKSTDAPILLIKTSWGGKSLNTDFRPPSAGPYTFSETQLADLQKKGKDIATMKADKEKETGVYYRLMIEHVKKVIGDIKRVAPEYDAAQGYELAGFAWFQGWNDLVDQGTYPNRDKPGGYDAYSTTMAHFIRDVRKDLNAPKMPFAIGVLGVGGPSVPSDKPDHKLNLRSAMAAPTLLPEFKGNVAAVMTEKYWDLELDAACAKRDKIKQQAKKPTAKGKKAAAVEDKAALDKLLAEGLSDRERLVIEKGVSNQGYHYLGSAKILGSIGKGLAESMIQLKK